MSVGIYNVGAIIMKGDLNCSLSQLSRVSAQWDICIYANYSWISRHQKNLYLKPSKESTSSQAISHFDMHKC